VVLALETYAESEKVAQTFFDRGLLKKARFCDKKCAVLGSKIALWLKKNVCATFFGFCIFF
jgi:hypothetical protein